jgi:hypothetical protein
MLGALMTTGLTAAVAPLLGEAYEIDAPSCVGFQIGSRAAAETRLSLENVGSAQLHGQIEFLDEEDLPFKVENDLILWSSRATVQLDPLESRTIVFRTPPLGTVAKVTLSTSNVRSSVEIVPADGGLPEPRHALICAVAPAIPSLNQTSDYSLQVETGGPGVSART